MGNKYELVKEVRLLDGKVLYRIKALKDIEWFGVHAGDFGGLVESYDNLSQDGNCWVDQTSRIFGNAIVHDDVLICDSSIVSENCEICDQSIIGNSQVSGTALILGTSDVRNCSVAGNTEICGKAYNINAFGNCTIFNCMALSCNRATIAGSSKVNIVAPLKNYSMYIGGEFTGSVGSILSTFYHADKSLSYRGHIFNKDISSFELENESPYQCFLKLQSDSFLSKIDLDAFYITTVIFDTPVSGKPVCVDVLIYKLTGEYREGFYQSLNFHGACYNNEEEISKLIEYNKPYIDRIYKNAILFFESSKNRNEYKL